MINEKEVLRKEEIDFRGVLNRFKRGWPIFLVFLALCVVLGTIFQVAYPPGYMATTKVLIEKPNSTSDPGALVSTMNGFVKPDDYYYTNQKSVMLSYPIIRTALNRIGTISYFKLGLFKSEIYRESPIVVELDSTFMNFDRTRTPYGGVFDVTFTNPDSYYLSVSGDYEETDKPYEVEGEFQFGEWIVFDNTRLRVRLSNYFHGLKPQLQDACFETKYGFVIEEPSALALRYKGSLQVEQEEIESTVFEVYLGGTAPTKQRDFLDELGNTFIEHHLNQKTQVLKLAITYLSDEIDHFAKELYTSEEAIEEFKTENAITSLNREGNLLMERTAEMQNKKVNYIVKDKYYTYLQDYLENNDNYGNLISPQAFGVKDPLISKLTENLLELQQERNYYEDLNAQSNPSYKKITSDIESIKKTILNSVKGVRTSNQVMMDNIDQRIREMEQNALEIPKAERDLLRLERLFKINDRVYKRLVEKKSESELILASTIPNIQIVEPAYLTSTEPLYPKVPLTYAAVIIIGLFLGFAYLIVKWIFNNTIDSPHELTKYIPSARVIGELYHTNIRKPDELADYPESTLASQLGAIIYRLKRQGPDHKLFAVSSYNPKEGKTFSASMLAMQSAMMGYKTLLVDGNFKNPNVKKLFKVSRTPGMLEVIEGKGDRVDMIASSGKENLDIADIGSASIVGARDAKAIIKMIDDLLPSYDCVFLDSAPLGTVSLSLAFLEKADINLLAVRRDKTSYQTLEEIQTLIEADTLKVDHFLVTDSFKPDVHFSIFGGSSSYRVEKPVSIFGRLRIVFKRV